jgi:hypothetical protein
MGNRPLAKRKNNAHQHLRYGAPCLAKVGVVGSNPIARSKILDLIESSPVTTLRAGRPLCRTGCMP